MTRILSLILAVVMVTSAVSGVVVAQAESEDESYFDQLREPGDQGASGLLPADASETATQAVSSALTLGPRVYERYLGGAADENATGYANNFQASFNEHNDSLVAYANHRMDASSNHDVIKIEFTDTDGNTATRYLVATVNNDSYTTAEIVDTTDKNVSDTITADWYASRHAATELDSFVTEYAQPNENVSGRYWASMVGKYGGQLNSTLWGDGV